LTDLKLENVLRFLVEERLIVRLLKHIEYMKLNGDESRYQVAAPSIIPHNRLELLN